MDILLSLKFYLYRYIMFLNAVLPSSVVNALKPLIQSAIDLVPITAKDLFYEIQNNGTSSNYFEPISEFFGYIFGNYSQTVMVDGHLMVGNGIDLTANPNAIALFYAMDPDQNWENILTGPGEPESPLTTDQINQLLCLSLIGVSNSNGTFNGYLVELNECLGDLAGQPFVVNQLFAITSTICIRNGTAPAYMELAMQDMLDNNWDLLPVGAIIDYSNIYASIVKQNQLLEIASMFHAKLSASDLDVYLTYQQKERLLLANPNQQVKVVGGPVKRGIPIGNLQEKSYTGFKNITRIKGLNPDKYSEDSNIFGTPQRDFLNYVSQYLTDSNSAAIFGGEGDDVITVDFGVSSEVKKLNAFFGAGNEGFDSYRFTSFDNYAPTRITFYDSDHYGVIIYSSDSAIPVRFSGAIVDNSFFITPRSDAYDVISTIEEDNTVTLSFSTFESGEILEILSYENGQFGILPNAESYHLADSSSLNICAVNNKNEIAICPVGHQGVQGEYDDGVVYIYDIDGTLKRKIQVLQNDTWADASMRAASDGNFYIAGIAQNSCVLTYTIVNPFNGTAITIPVDKGMSSNCFPLAAFPQSLLTATDILVNTIAMVYVKEETESQYGLYLYMPFGNITRIDNINSKIMDGMYAYNSVYAGSINNGFHISSLQRIFTETPYSSIIYELNSMGDLLKNYTRINTTIIGISPLPNGYFLYYQHPFNDNQTMPDQFGGTYSRVFSDGYWSQPFQMTWIVSDIYNKYSGPIMQYMEDGSTMLLDGLYISIFSLNNTLDIGPSLLGPYLSSPMSWLGTRLLSTGDILVTYTSNADIFRPEQRTLVFPTSYLSVNYQSQSRVLRSTPRLLQYEDVDIQSNSLRAEEPIVFHAELSGIVQTSAAMSALEHNLLFKSTFLLTSSFNVITQKITSMISTAAQLQITDDTFESGRWSDQITYDGQTGEPIFTYVVTQANQLIGSAEFLGAPLLREDAGGQGNNIVKTSGIFSTFLINAKMSVQEVCQMLPQTLFDQAVCAGAQQGALHAGANLIGFTLRSAGVSKPISQYLSKFLYYTGFFSMRFSVYLEQQQGQQEVSTQMNAIYSAAADTGQLILTEMVYKAASYLLNKASDALVNNSWNKLGGAFKKAGSLMRFGMFAWNADQQTAMETVKAVATGALITTIADKFGDYATSRNSRLIK